MDAQGGVSEIEGERPPQDDVLPDGWAVATIGAITSDVRKVRPQDRYRETFQYLDLASICNQTNMVLAAKTVEASRPPSRARQLVGPNDVLFSCVRVYLRNVAIIPERYDGQIASTAFAVLRAKPEIAHRYIFHFLLWQRTINSLTALQRGNSPPAVLEKDVRAYEIPLAPTSEQHRIVSKIDELFSDIAAGERALARARAALRRYRKAVLKAAVTGELTADWREANRARLEPAEKLLTRILDARRAAWEKAERARLKAKGKLPGGDAWKKKYKEPGRPEFDFLGLLPDEWVSGSVDLFGQVQLGRQRAPKHHNGDHMRPYLRVANVFEERIDTSDIMRMNFTPAEFESYKLKEGDILLNEGQSAELVGRPAIYRNEVPGACFTNTLVRFRVYAGLENEFALLVFRHFMHSGYFTRIARITTNIAHLGADRFASMNIPCPPIEEQREIVSRTAEAFSKADHVEAALDAQERAAKALRQSILKAAFEGRLVPQDPNDEPAAKLLERLKKQRGK